MSQKPFRLYMTPTSPFARKCRMVVHECGLQERVEEFDARVRTDENEVLEVSPLGKVPTLTGPNGLTLVDSTLISEFLDKLDGPPKLHGFTDQDRWNCTLWWNRHRLHSDDVYGSQPDVNSRFTETKAPSTQSLRCCS